MKPLFRSPTGRASLGPVPGSEFHNQRAGHLHGGVDLNCRMGDIIIAPRAGIITMAGLSTGLGGNKVEIDHGILSDGNRHYTKHYHFGPKMSHWEDVIFVRVGDLVKAGQPLGIGGMSGNATAPHDHYEHLVNGVPKDPLQFLTEYQVIRRFLSRLRLALAYPKAEGPDIPLMQHRLTVHGFPCLSDGVYGPHTEWAVGALQRAKGLDDDLIVGRDTWRALLKRPVL